MFFNFIKETMNAIHQEGEMKEHMLIDITQEDGETERYTQEFIVHLEKRKEQYLKDKAAGKNVTFNRVVLGAVYDSFGVATLKISFVSFLSDLSAVGYTALIMKII
jgi:predicted HicB family RNase H-like nuclease